MQTQHITLWQLFCRSFLLSGTTVGGGFVILSMMEKIYVRRLGWLNEEEMLDITSLAQSAPGAVAVNASLLAGNRLRGTAGAAVSLLGCILPPFGIMCLLGSLYGTVRNSGAVTFLLPAIRILLGLYLAGIAVSLCRKQLNTLFFCVVYAITLTGLLIFHIQSIWFLAAAVILSVIRYSGGKRHE